LFDISVVETTGTSSPGVIVSVEEEINVFRFTILDHLSYSQEKHFSYANF